MTTYVVMVDDRYGYLARWSGKSLDLVLKNGFEDTLCADQLTIIRCRWRRPEGSPILGFSMVSWTRLYIETTIEKARAREDRDYATSPDR